MFPPRPSSLAHLSDDEAARSLSRHFGDIVAAARDLGVDRTDLRRLTWSNPMILDAAHDRVDLFLGQVWDEAARSLNHRSARVRERAVDRLCAHPRMLGSPFASGLSVFARAPRARVPNPSAAAERALERQASAERERELAAERDAEAERERALVFERERVLEEERGEVLAERRPPTPAMSLWAPSIRRPSRGGWR
jgi:hypothetical protein